MAGVLRLEDLKNGAAVRGIEPEDVVTVFTAISHGPDVVQVIYKTPTGERSVLPRE